MGNFPALTYILVSACSKSEVISINYETLRKLKAIEVQTFTFLYKLRFFLRF